MQKNWTSDFYVYHIVDCGFFCNLEYMLETKNDKEWNKMATEQLEVS